MMRLGQMLLGDTESHIYQLHLEGKVLKLFCSSVLHNSNLLTLIFLKRETFCFDFPWALLCKNSIHCLSVTYFLSFFQPYLAQPLLEWHLPVDKGSVI